MQTSMQKTYQYEGVANPKAAPAHRALWDGDVLAVDSDGDRRRFAHCTAADIRLDPLLLHRHHGQRCGGGQPIGFVIAAGVIAYVSRVTVQEGHGVEPRQAGASQTCN